MTIFRRALRAAVHAKNSLSRIKGFTPEQAVLGKMARLPGSLISDNMAASHALAESDLPEGVAFRRDLQRKRRGIGCCTGVDRRLAAEVREAGGTALDRSYVVTGELSGKVTADG